MKEKVRGALNRDRTVDITTVGRRTGKPRRIEIWLHHLSGELYLTGTPGLRDWVANMWANPKFTLHLKGTVKADMPARARVITDSGERRQILSQILSGSHGDRELENWVRRSPLVEVTVESED